MRWVSNRMHTCVYFEFETHSMKNKEEKRNMHAHKKIKQRDRMQFNLAWKKSCVINILPMNPIAMWRHVHHCIACKIWHLYSMAIRMHHEIMWTCHMYEANKQNKKEEKARERWGSIHTMRLSRCMLTWCTWVCETWWVIAFNLHGLCSFFFNCASIKTIKMTQHVHAHVHNK